MAHPSYFVVMVEYERAREAVVNPEYTRRDIVHMIASGEYKHINFIHHVDGGLVEDVTQELCDEAEALALQAAE